MKPSRKFLSSVIFICMGTMPAHAAGILNIGGGPASNISGGPTFTPLNPALDAVVAETSVVSALGSNPLVVVSNSGDPAGTSISVLGAVSWANSNTLTIDAATSLTVSANVSNVVGGGSLNLFANNGGVQLNGLVDISNALTVNATAGINQNNLHILRAGGLATFNSGSSDITLNGPNNNFGSLHLTGGAVSITEASSSSLAGVNAASLNLVSSGAITQTGAAKVTGAASFNAGANAITLTNAGNQFGTISLNGTSIVINEQDATDLGNVTASSLSVISGGGITNSGNVAVTGAAILNGTSINLGGGAGTASVGSLNFNTTGSASFSLLSGTSITGANTAGSFIWNTNGNASLAAGATITSTTADIQQGTVTLSANNQLAVSGNLSLQSGATLNLGTFNNTVGTYSQTGSANLNGTGTLTATTYNLSGGNVNANLGTGTINQVGNTTTFLNGTSAASAVNINIGTLALGSSNRLHDSAAVAINGGRLNLESFNDTVGSFAINTGILDGTGTLTAATYSLNGGTVNANLGAGVLSQIGGTTLLNGISSSATVDVDGGTLELGASERLSNSAALAVNAGTLNLAGFNETVSTFALNGGSLNGTGTLTAATYALNGGTVNANLGAGVLTQLANNTLLNGTALSTDLNINGGTLSLGASERLNDAAALKIAGGTLNLGSFNETVGTFSINTGTLDGTGTLTAATYALSGGAINGNLGAGILNQLVNTTLLNGSSSAATVNITGGTLELGADNRLFDNSALTISGVGILDLKGFNDTVGTFVLNDGTLNGTGTLTAATYGLNGGTVNGNLGAGILTQLSNITQLNGTSSAANVGVNGGTLRLGASNRMLDSAAVTVLSTGTLDLAGFDDTAGTFTLNGGLLNGTGTLTATTYSLNGGTVNANLGTGTLNQLLNTTTLNGTSAAGVVNINGGSLALGASNRLSDSAAVTINNAILNLGAFNDTVGTFALNGGSLNGSGTLTAATYDLNGGTVNANLGAGTLNQVSGTTLLNGTSGASVVNVNGGTLTLGSSDRLHDSAALTINTGTLNLGAFNDTVGTFTLNGGILDGTGTLTATTYDLNGGTVNANLGAGILTQLSNTTTLNGTSAAATVNINGGTLTLGAADRLLDTAAVTIASAGTLNLGTFNDAVGTFTLNGGILNGTGTLTAATYDLNGGTVNANLGAGILNQLSNTTTLNGTSAAATVNINGGTLTLGGAERLLNTAELTINSGILNLGSFSETVGAFTLNTGVLDGTGTLTAATYDLKGGTVNANLGAGILTQLSNTTTLNGSAAAATVNINGGTLTLGASDCLLNTAAVTIASAGTLNLGTFNDTVGSFTLNGGILDGTGTLTATTYDLNGGTVNANLGAGVLTQLANTTTLNGTSSAATVNINGGTLTLGASDRLLDTAAVTIASAGTLNLGAFSDIVGSFTLNGGILDGTGTLTAATYDLNGGTVNANLGAGILTQLSDITTLNGTSAAATVNINGGTLTLGASDRLLDTASVTIASAGTLNLGAFSDTVGTFTLNGGILNGSGTLTAATYDLNGGTVNANLGEGILTQLSNITTLNGTSSAATVNINGGTLTLGASDRLLDTAAVTIASAGTLNLGTFSDTVGSFTLNGGILDGTGTLTAATYDLNGGTVNANLGAGILTQLSNLTTLNGTSSAATVNINGGTLTLGASDRLLDTAAVTIASAGTLNLGTFSDTVGTFTLNGGILDGSGTLTAATYDLNGGTVNANLGAGILTQLSNTTTLNGTSAAATVNINGGTLALGASNRLLDSAAVTIASAGTLNLGTFSDTVGTFTLNGGILDGTGTLTAATYDLNGGTVNANLGAGILTQLSNTTTLNGTSAAATVNINGGTLTLGASDRLLDSAAVTIASAGTLNLGTFSDIVGSFTLNGGILDGSGTLTAATYDLNGGTVNANLGAGIFTQLSNTTTLNGTSSAATVNINGGTLTLGASDRLLDSAAVTIASAGTLNLGTFSDTVGTFTLNGGILDGSGTLTAATYDLNGGTLNANLGAGILTQLSNTTTLNGTSAAATVNINGGTLTLGASDRLLDSAAVTIASAGTLNLGIFSDTVGTFTLNGGILDGTGTLTAATYDLNGGTVNANLGAGTLNQLANTTTLNGTSAAATVNINGGTLTLGSSDRLLDTAAVTIASAGTLNLGGFNDTVGTFTLNGGVFDGSGTLTAATYALNGGTVNANLGSGILTQLSNITTLNGSSSAATVNINGGTLTLGASDRLLDTAAVTIASAGTLNLGTFSDTVGTFTLNGGILNGTGTLTAATYDLNGGTVNANLGTGTLNQLTNTTTLNGTSAAGIVNINGGTLALGASDRLSDTADVTVTNGTLDIGAFNDTVGSFTLVTGVLTGSGNLTAGTYNLSGSTINSDLGTGTINQIANNTLLNGTSAASVVNVNGGTLTLGASERLSDTATLTINSGSTFNLQAFDETVGTLALNGGDLDGTGTLTAGNYNLSGGMVNANLGIGTLTQLAGTTILNGTAAASSININGGTLTFGASDRFATTADVAVNGGILNLGNFSNTVASFTLSGGSLNGQGLLTAATYDLNGGTINANLGAGILNQLSNTTNLNGTTAALDINIKGGTIALGSSELFANNATITIDAPGTLNMRTFSEVVEDLFLNGGTINGTGTLTATEYNLGGGIVNAKLGTGNLTQLSGTTLLNGTSAANHVTIEGGTLALGASARLSVAAAVQLNGGSLALGTFSDTVGDFTVNGGTLSGTGTLSAASYTLRGGQLNANLGTGIVTQLDGITTLSGTTAAGTININGGTLRLGASNRFANSARTIIAGGTLDLGAFSDTVTTFSISGGSLDGTGKLTADTYSLLGGTVNANLGTGILSQDGGTTTLRGRSDAEQVRVLGGTLALGASERLSDAATLRVVGASLDLGAFNERVTTFNLFDGSLNGTGTLTANTYFLRGGTIGANLGSGKIEQLERTTKLLGTTGSRTIRISGGVLELGASDRIANAAFVRVVDAGVLNLGNFDDRVRIYVQNDDANLKGTGELFVTDKAKLKGGTVNANISGDVIVEGKTTIAGSIGGGKLDVNTGSLTLLGTAESDTRINTKASLSGTGTIDGDMKNLGNLAVDAGGRNKDLTVSGKLENSGTVTLSLRNKNTFESITAGKVQFGGRLVVVNNGAGLAKGQAVQLFKAGSYAKAFKSVVAVGFKGKLAFNSATGSLVRLGNGVSLEGRTLAKNVNKLPASAAIKSKSAIAETGAGKRDITAKAAPGRPLSAEVPVAEPDAETPENTGDSALLATASKAAPVANNLSPEVHRSLADYTEQALRSHVRDAMGQGTIGRVGKTEAFASTSYHESGLDGGASNAGYDIDLVGVTIGTRHQFNQQAMLGALIGYDDGDIQGNLIRSESSGFALGAFGSYVVDHSSNTRLIASATFGRYEHDATRQSAGGDVFADGIQSDAFEFTLGVSTVVYEKDGLRITPSAMLRHMTGAVDGFTESGPGTSLAVGSQDIDSSLLELGIDFDYAVRPDFNLVGHVGYIFDLDGSDESVSARNTAPGSLPFSVNAPGIDNEALVLGLGAYYDVTDNLRVGLTYRADFRSSDSESAQSVGIGASLSF